MSATTAVRADHRVPIARIHGRTGVTAVALVACELPHPSHGAGWYRIGGTPSRAP